jgi:hypothetical protein
MAFELGQIVTHARKHEWGLGKILRLDADQCVVFFLDAGPRNGATKNPMTVLTDMLLTAKIQSHPRLDNLAPLQGDSVTEGEAYVSLAEGTARFLRRFPRGFADAGYLKKERNYKWEAHEECRRLLSKVQLSKLLERRDHGEIADRALRVAGMVNLPTRWDHMALNDALKNPLDQERFAAALFDLLHGEAPEQQRFTEFAKVLGSLPQRQSPVLSWPNQTILPFLYAPKHQMFMKPGVTKQAANRCAFDLRYQPEPNWTTYSQLLKLSETLFAELEDLGPRDNIDVQSFIWLIGDK